MAPTLNFKFTIIFVLLTAMFYAQPPAIQWQKTYGGSGLEEASAVSQAPDGGFIAAGFTQSNNGDVSGNHGAKDAWVVKTTPSGSIAWQKTLGGTGDDEALALTKTPDGGYIIAGYTLSANGDVPANHGREDAWIIKLDAVGTIKWQHVLGGSYSDRATAVQSTSDGGCIVAGYMGSSDGDGVGNHGAIDGWLLKLSADGTIEWQKMIGGTAMDMFYSVAQTADGGFIAGGTTASSDGQLAGGTATQNNYDSLAVKFDASGNIQWHKSLGGSSQDFTYSILQGQNGGYFLTGYTVSPDVPGYHGNCDLWAASLSPEGNVSWQKALGGSLIDQGFQSLLCDNGDYMVAGFTGANDGDVQGSHGNCDFWMLRLDSSGTVKWQKTMGGSLLDRATCIAKTADNGYVLAGYTWSSDAQVTQSHGNDDFWMVRVLPETGLSAQTFDSGKMVLFPNPAGESLSMDFPEGNSPVTISVYDFTGRLVIRQAENVKVDISRLETGRYFVEAAAAEKRYRESFFKK